MNVLHVVKWRAVSRKRIYTPSGHNTLEQRHVVALFETKFRRCSNVGWPHLRDCNCRLVVVNDSKTDCELVVNCSYHAQTVREVRRPVVNSSLHQCVKYTWSCEARPHCDAHQFVNMSWTTRELDVCCSWTLRDTRDMVRIGTHNPALSRRVHDEFTNSSHIVHDPVAKFCRDQNFEHFKILVPTWHAVTTGLRTLHASWRLVYASARLQSCQCVPQNRASVKLA